MNATILLLSSIGILGVLFFRVLGPCGGQDLMTGVKGDISLFLNLHSWDIR
jgi:hypothetical protein